jgi:hypothetical protein
MALGGSPALAVPALQLDIDGGVYVAAPEETIFATSNSFSLYAYGLASKISTADTFYLSMALVPSTSMPGTYGSFKINDTTINVTTDMSYGNPPLETALAHDPGDLAPHGIFPTYFAELSLSFAGASQSGIYNTQDEPGSGPHSGTGMYYVKFDVDVSGLLPGLGIHFDLYNTKLIEYCKKKVCYPGDVDIDDHFAPFSHDAAGMVNVIPEPQTYAMLLAGLGLLGFMARRRQKALAAA